jgi:hypothetical protein
MVYFIFFFIYSLLFFITIWLIYLIYNYYIYRLKDIKNNKNDKKIKRINYLFCYGSNSIEQIKERLNINCDIQYFPAYINNYTRIFAGKSKKWDNGGVASIYPFNNCKVYGIVIILNDIELQKLDEFEGGYKRKFLKGFIQNLTLKKNKKELFQVYIKENILFKEFPSNNYLKAINKMLNDRHFINNKDINIEYTNNQNIDIQNTNIQNTHNQNTDIQNMNIENIDIDNMNIDNMDINIQKTKKNIKIIIKCIMNNTLIQLGYWTEENGFYINKI